MKLKIAAPTPTAAKYTGLGRWPITHVSTSPTSGVDEFATMAGPAIAQILLLAPVGFSGGYLGAAVIVRAQSRYTGTRVMPCQLARRCFSNLPALALSSGHAFV